MAQKMLLGLLLALWLTLAQSATLAPKGDEAEKKPSLPPFNDDVPQQQIPPDEIPMEFLLQKEIGLEEGLDLPVLIHGEPQVRLSAPISPRARRPSGCFNGLLCTREAPRYKLDEFPPARPTTSNIGNICSEGRKKLSYGPWNLPQTSFSHLSRQGDALNNLEAGVSECCQLENGEEILPCCTDVWQKVLTQYCKQEFSVKTRPHMCCKEDEMDARFSCFADLAPYPAYDKEITSVSLADITSPLLDSLCGRFTLLSKQRQIPALIQNITEPCCQLQGSDRIYCAEEEKSQFIANLCGARRKTWKDPERCCDEEDDEAREKCFNSNYLSSVSLASVGQPTAVPTEPAVETQTK